MVRQTGDVYNPVVNLTADGVVKMSKKIINNILL